VPAVRSYGSQLVDSCRGLPSARNSYVVRTQRSPPAMPSRAAMSAGAGTLASVRLSQSLACQQPSCPPGTAIHRAAHAQTTAPCAHAAVALRRTSPSRRGLPVRCAWLLASPVPLQRGHARSRVAPPPVRPLLPLTEPRWAHSSHRVERPPKVGSRPTNVVLSYIGASTTTSVSLWCTSSPQSWTGRSSD
jgi:hypothetical protein